MADGKNSLKQILLRGVEAAGRKAASLADCAGEHLRELSAKRQMDEVRRQLADAAEEAFEKEEPLPERITILLSELNRLKETCKAEESLEESRKNEETKETAVEEEMPDAGNEN